MNDSPHYSPYIPRSIDNTALDAYMSCPRKYYYGMVLHRRRRNMDSSSPPALSYGTTWHAILEAHYKSGGDPDLIIDAAYRSWKPHGNPEDHRTLERVVSEYANYIKRWGDHNSETRNWGTTVGFGTSAPLVEIPVEIWWPGARHPYAGKIDRIYDHNGLYYVEDHKTTAAMGSYYFSQFDPSNQMMGYASLAKHYTGLPIAGVRINAHAVLKASSKFERQTMMFSDERLIEWESNLDVWLERLENAHTVLQSIPFDASAEVRDHMTLRAFPHNFNACAGKYGQCAYSSVCTFTNDLRPRILEAEFDVAPWDPLNPEGLTNEG